MSINYGATRQEWEAFSSLILSDLLPTITDPNVRMSARSQLKGPNTKTPSIVNDRGEGQGILGWPTKVTTSVDDWIDDPRLGICIIARTIHAIDIDVSDIAEAEAVEAFIRVELGMAGLAMPLRSRPNSGKRLLMYRLIDAPEGRLKKTTARVNEKGEIVEFLHQSQQFLVAGAHPTGVRYEMPGGIPASIDDIPLIEMSDLVDLHHALNKRFMAGVTEPENWTFDGKDIQAAVRNKTQVNYSTDPMVLYLEKNDWVKDYAPDGGLYVTCPWQREHTTESNPSETKFFPIGLGENKAHPGFNCQHAHCLGRGHQAFLNEIGYTDEAFEVMPLTPELAKVTARPNFVINGKTNIINGTLSNVAKLIQWPSGFLYEVRYDRFKDSLMYRYKDGNWQLLDDDTYTEMRLRAADMNFDPLLSKELVRDAVSYVARKDGMDSAQEWLNAQVWDGVSRLATFHTRVLKLDDTPYHHAAMMYLWTALAGRVLDPGCKADMVPILVGNQGLRKSTLVEILAPSMDEFTSVSLTERDADLARRLRGKLVAEWGELRGLESREAEAVKDWVAQRKDDWIPKFKEFGTTLPRRFVLIGTTNHRQFLSDPTGARRWLPIFISSTIDTQYVLDNLFQLWAEAKMLWEQTGVRWQDAERLAKPAQRLATVRDVWVEAVQNWLVDQGGAEGWTTGELLYGACNVQISNANRSHLERLRRVMVYIGWEQTDEGIWHSGLA